MKRLPVRDVAFRRLGILRMLAYREPKFWSRPMDIGGRDGSHHSRTLASLCKLGLCEKKRRGSICNALNSSRGSYVYRITKAGREALDRAEGR